jgi:uncharacterized protein YggE
MRGGVTLLTVAALALLAAACTRSDTINVTPSVEPPGITVTGRGEAEAPPDTGYITLGVQVTGRTVAEAREQAAVAAASVIEAVKATGVAAADIQTANFSINPQYEYPTREPPRLIGYQVSNTVSVRVRDLDRFSTVIDEAAAAGGDTVIVSSLRFDYDDPTELADEARELAVADARRKAEQLARLSGVSLGDPVTIVEGLGGAAPVVRFEAAAFSRQAGSSTPIETGTGKVVVEVAVRWSIR